MGSGRILYMFDSLVVVNMYTCCVRGFSHCTAHLGVYRFVQHACIKVKPLLFYTSKHFQPIWPRGGGVKKGTPPV